MHNYKELLFIGFILNFRCCFVCQALGEIILSSFSEPLFDNDDKLILTDNPIYFNCGCHKSAPVKKGKNIFFQASK